MKKEHLTSLLWIEFKETIEASWASNYQRQFGDILPLHEMEQPFNFARAVHKKAEQRFALQKIGVVIVSVDTINNALQKDGISAKSKNKSLDFFAAFAGYQNWKEFELTARHRLKKEKLSLTPPVKTPVKQEVKLETKPKVKLPHPAPKKSRWDRWKYVLLLLLLVFLVCFLYFHHQRRKIVELVNNVNAAEFTAFETVPGIDTAYFNTYLTADANSRLTVRNVVNGSIEKGYILKSSSSYHDVNEVTLNTLWWTTATVTTKEQWDLRWHDAETGEFIKKYDQVNVQNYNLRYIDGQWMIDANAYEGRHTDKE